MDWCTHVVLYTCTCVEHVCVDVLMYSRGSVHMHVYMNTHICVCRMHEWTFWTIWFCTYSCVSVQRQVSQFKVSFLITSYLVFRERESQSLMLSNWLDQLPNELQGSTCFQPLVLGLPHILPSLAAIGSWGCEHSLSCLYGSGIVSWVQDQSVKS